MTRPMAFDCGGESVRVNTRSAQDLLALTEDRLSRGAGFAAATINLDHITKLRKDKAFRDAYLAQTFVVADGNPIVWMSRLAGRPVELAPGSELIRPMAAMAARIGAPVSFLGATEAALSGAETALKAEFPDLQVAAKIAPPFGYDPMGEAAAADLKAIADSGAKLCFLALGAPKQEVLAARGLDLAPGVGFVSIGAGLDFLAGTQKRAPEWVQKLAMEWFWRMASNPSRLAKRYALCAALLPGLMREAQALKRADEAAAQES